MADKAHVLTDKKLEEMEKRLSAIYSEAEKDLQKKADNFFDKFKKADEINRKKVKNGEMTEDEYKEWRKKKVMRGKQYTDMKRQVAENLLHTNEIAIAYINGEIPEVYALGYNALASTVDGVGGYSFSLVDPDTVRNLATTDSSLLPYKKLNPAKDVAWNMQKVNSQVLQGVIQGESIPKIAKRIKNVQEMNRASAIRTARTIVTGAENKGRMDSYKRAEADGIILQKKWLSSNQAGRTRDCHFPSSFENLEVDTDKPFVNEMGEIMFPGDPTAKGANVYNCRCSMRAIVKGFKKAQVEKAVEELEENTVQTGGFAQAQTKTELNQRLSQATGSNADFLRMDLSLANEYLEGFESFYDEYPALRGFVSKIDTNVHEGLTGEYRYDYRYTKDLKYDVRNSVALSPMYNAEQTHKMLSRSIEQGFHFEGMTPQGLARHECTHALDSLIGNTRKGYVKNGKFVSLDGTISANVYNQSVASEILDEVRAERYDEWLTGYFDDVKYLGDYAMTSDKEMLAQCIAYETSGQTHPFSAEVKKRFDKIYKEVLG